MAFLHESPLLEKLFPAVKTNFVEERIRLSFALASLAFDNKVPYWGWRFTSWGVHYLQDVTQPYHARAFPPSALKIIRAYLLDPDPEGLRKRIGKVLKKHHMLFEAVLHLLLNEAVKKSENHRFLEALSLEQGCPDGPLRSVMENATEVAAISAKAVDRLLMILLAHPKMYDGSDFLAEDPGRALAYAVNRARETGPEVFSQFVDRVCVCLRESGRVTRFAVERMTKQLNAGARA